MVTEATARALKHLSDGKMFTRHGEDNDSAIAQLAVETVNTDPIIDLQTIYDDFSAGTEPVNYYETELRPPWINAMWAYENRHGNPILLMTATSDVRENESDKDDIWEVKGADHDVDWDRVRWRWAIIFWTARADGVYGPLFTSKIAVYDDGTPADISYQCMFPGDHPLGNPAVFETELAMLLKGVDIANCRNVEAVPAHPSGDRAARRRVQRALGDVKVSTLSISPTGKSYQGPRSQGGQGTPLTSVRGHVAHYGACCSHHEPKGLLFGRYTCRVWVPEHSRGDENLGENRHTYEVTT